MRKASKAFYQGLFQAFEFTPPKKKRSDSGVITKRWGFGEYRLNPASDWERILSDTQATVKQYESGELNKQQVSSKLSPTSTSFIFECSKKIFSNELRQVPTHHSSMRIYDEEQYKFPEWLQKELCPRLDDAESRLKTGQVIH